MQPDSLETLSQNPRRAGAVALGALAVGAFALGALAIGALKIGRLTVHRLRVGRSHMRTLAIDDLEVGTLRVHKLEVPRPPGNGRGVSVTRAAGHPPARHPRWRCLGSRVALPTHTPSHEVTRDGVESPART
jgi:hypothetical protein